MKDFQNKWALITGASSGIGAEFARQLAALGANLVITARRQDRLEELAENLREKHSVKVEIVACDLTEIDATARLMEEVEKREISIDLLVNNAGFGISGRLVDADRERVNSMVQLNMVALTDLMYRALPKMLERKSGAIINVASLAAFQPLAYMGAYAATKAYVLHLSESIWVEARKQNVTVLAVCPGFTHSEFFDIAEMSSWVRSWAHTPPQVVKSSLRALRRKKPVVVVGLMNYIVSLLPRVSMRRVVVGMTSLFFKPDTPHGGK